MEYFADAVFAIAFTLSVVELELPREGGASLPHDLAGMWHGFLGVAIASSVIGIHWAHHHFSGAIYRTVGHWFNLATLLFLAAIGFIAFPSRVLADHIDDPEGFPAAATFFMIGLAVIAATWSLKWLVGRLMGNVDDRLDPAYVRRLSRTYFASTVLMIAAAALSVALPVTSLVLGGLILAYFVLPPGTPVYRGAAPAAGGGED
ncbi:MAG TPA: TMEM175 family protein [Allosphingosinicella sp.]